MTRLIQGRQYQVYDHWNLCNRKIKIKLLRSQEKKEFSSLQQNLQQLKTSLEEITETQQTSFEEISRTTIERIEEEKESIVALVNQSKLLVDCEMFKSQSSLLSTQIPNFCTQEFKLLFRGSRDGFTAKRFHEFCDNKGPTVQFIQSEKGFVFGGYTSIQMISPTDDALLQNDSDAFVFSLSKRSIHKQYQYQQYAIRHDKDRMCAFGGGSDIAILDNCDKNTKNYSCLGYTYEPPNGYKDGTEEAYSYLAGEHNFKVLEIEVYQLQ
eukprot:403358553